jgi:hypothetical protein
MQVLGNIEDIWSNSEEGCRLDDIRGTTYLPNGEVYQTKFRHQR